MLENLDDTSLDTQRKWLRFMLERVGTNHLTFLLEYYENLGWIGQDVTNRLIELAKEEKQYIATSWKLSSEEHRKSMLFIEKIMGMEIDSSLLSVTGQGVSVPVEKKRATEGFLEAHRKIKDEKNMEILRREVTIKNLEEELKKRDDQTDHLKEEVRKLKDELTGCKTQVKKDLIYRKILKENMKLKKT